MTTSAPHSALVLGRSTLCATFGEHFQQSTDRFGLTSPIKRQWTVEYGHSLNRLSMQTIPDRIASAHAQDVPTFT